MATARGRATLFPAVSVTAVPIPAALPGAGRAAGGPAAGAPTGPAAQTGGNGRSSQSGTPAQAPEPPGVATPAVSRRSLPVSGGAGGIVMVVVSTARSGATRAWATWQPRRRSRRRTRAAAPRSESADPLRPRVGTRSTPSSRSPSRNATSVVAFPTSTPAITVTWAARNRDHGDLAPHPEARSP